MASTTSPGPGPAGEDALWEALWDALSSGAEAEAATVATRLPSGPGRDATVAWLDAQRARRSGDAQGCIDACDAGLHRLDSGDETPAPLLWAHLAAVRFGACADLGWAGEAVRSALDALRSLRDQEGPHVARLIVRLHTHLGAVMGEAGDPAAALEHLDQALDRATGDPGLQPDLAQVHLQLGAQHLQGTGDLGTAIYHLGKGLLLANQLRLPALRRRARLLLARARHRQGQAAAALVLLDSLEDQRSDLTTPADQAELLLLRADLLSRSASAEAERCYLAAFQRAESIDATHLMMRVARALTDHLEVRGRWAQACVWHRQCRELKRTLLHRERAAHRDEMRARFRIEQTEHDLAEALRRASAAAEAKDRFLAVISHELRTPLNAVQGYADLLLDELDEGGPVDVEAVAHDLGRIRAAAGGLVDHVDRILLLTSLGAGEDGVKPVEVDPALALRRLLDDLAPSVEDRGNRLEAVLDTSLSDASLPMRTDEQQVSSTIRQLVANANAFTEHGTVTVHARRTGDALCIDVTDTGRGFDASRFEELLQPFQQVDASSTRTHGGLGIGLTLCWQHARALGGVLTAESVPGGGATFRLTIPWRLEAAPTG